MNFPLRTITAALLLLGLAACAVPDPETDEIVELGDFRLLSNVAVTTNARKMGVSREADAEAWEEVLETAIDKRFARYEGETPYILSYSLDGYILATKGGRLALAPRSAMSMTVHIWQTEPQKRLAERSKQLLVLEQFDGETFIGSGLFRAKEEQMENLAAQFAKAVERWLLANGDLFGSEVSEEDRAAAAKDDLAALTQEAQQSTDQTGNQPADTAADAPTP